VAQQNGPLAAVNKNVPNISQGNVVAYLRCGGKLFNDNFINLQP